MDMEGQRNDYLEEHLFIGKSVVMSFMLAGL